MRLVSAIVLILALAGCHREDPPKLYSIKGVVVQVDVANKAVSLDAEKIAGWMDAMTMDYPVRDAAALGGLKVGDHITATVHVKQDLSYWIDHIAK